MNKFEKRKKIVIFGCCITAMILLMIMVFVFLNSDRSKVNELLDLGQKYLDELEYESAILIFDEAIAIDPKCAEAYLGKAKAQYALKQYQDAINTLEEGIRKVDDSSELKAFLQKILSEFSARNNGELSIDDVEVQNNVEEIPEEIITESLELNYTEIVRSINTEDPIIQLEVLGGNDSEDYIWESSNSECATVSDTGLVTCLPVEGRAQIYFTVKVNDIVISDFCDVYIYDPSNDPNCMESETFMMETKDKKQDRYLITLSKEDGEQVVEIDNRFADYIYYSGDIEIPEQLVYKNEKLPITNVSEAAFRWCNTMESVFIPDSIKDLEGFTENPFYYCTQLKEIKVDEKNEYFQSIDGVLYSKDGKELIAYPAAKNGNIYTIPKEVEQVYNGAFIGCKNLEQILVEEGNQFYESIDGVLMDKAEKRLMAYPIGNKLSSYTIPEYITNVDHVFYMSKLEEIVWKSSVNISDYQFDQCNQLKRIEGGSSTEYISLPKYKCSIEGIEEMKDLRRLEFVLSETQDMDGFSALQQLETLDVNVDSREVDLQVFGELENLRTLRIYKMENVKDISWLAGMDQLEEISFGVLTWDDYENYYDEYGQYQGNYINKDLDLQVLGSLKNLSSLKIDEIDSIDDISWLAGMEGIYRIDLNMKKSEIKDLTPLFELQNLNTVIIRSEEYVVDENIKEQVEELKKTKPEAYIDIFNM